MQLLETYRFENEVWIVMEHCDAGTLDSILLSRECGPMDELTTACIVKMLLLGLNHLHENKKIHRDIKGANILVNSRGECKIADFGLSKLLESTNAGAGSLCGTPFFVAPEICLRKTYNAKVDIWSLGILSYVLLTGNVPRFLRHLKPVEVMQLIPAADRERWMLPSKVQHRPGQMPYPRGTGWSAELNDFMRCCLEPNPELRATAFQLLHHPYIMRVPRYVSEEVPLVLCATAFAAATNNMTQKFNIPGVNAEYYCKDEYDDDGAGAALMFSRVVERCRESIQAKAEKNELTAEEKRKIRYNNTRGTLLEIGMNFDDLFLGEDLPREIRVNAPLLDDPDPKLGDMSAPSTPASGPATTVASPPQLPMKGSPAPSSASNGEMTVAPRGPHTGIHQGGMPMPHDETCALDRGLTGHAPVVGGQKVLPPMGAATPPSRPMLPPVPSPMDHSSPGTPAQPPMGVATPPYHHHPHIPNPHGGAVPTRLPFSAPSNNAAAPASAAPGTAGGRTALIGMGVGRPGIVSPGRK